MPANTLTSDDLWAGILDLVSDQPGSYSTAPEIFVQLVQLGFALPQDGKSQLTGKGQRAFTVAECGDGEGAEYRCI
jgi:hypothetical protein